MGFQKVVKNLDETELTCAQREFNEETNINKNDYKLLNFKTIEELYMSTNKIKYRHIYYLAQYNSLKNIVLNKENRQQNIEISEIKWLKYNEILNCIRDYNIERINILNTIYFNIVNLILDTKNKIKNVI